MRHNALQLRRRKSISRDGKQAWNGKTEGKGIIWRKCGEYKQPEKVLEHIEKAIDLVCDKEVKQVVITIRTGLNCRIMQMAKDKIKIVRETSNAESFEQ